tara:strand:+ start:211 stop:720 length:510 start_codon:yes stop_codon:yes gene_type:complete
MVRKSPKYSATIYPVNTTRIGIDGNIWQVINTKKSKKWILSKDKTINIIKNPEIYLYGSLKKNHNDIIKSTILNQTYNINKFHISYYKKNNRLYIYHNYSSANNYQGRWYAYNLFKQNNYSFNGKNNIFTYIISEYEWETESEIKIYKNVPIKIYFTEIGWNKFMEYIL